MSAAIATAVMALAAGVAHAMPPGRAWSPYEVMSIPGSIDFLGMPWLEEDSDGIPYHVMQVRWAGMPAHVWAGFTWNGSVWAPSASSPFVAGGLARAVLQPGGPGAFVTLSERDASFNNWLLVFDAGPDSIGPPDSVFVTTSQSTEYAAAAASRRRWAIRSDNTDSVYVNHVHVAYSDTARIWHEVERLGVNEDHCTVAPLGDTTAMVVYAGASGLEYAILDGARWIERGNLDRRPFNAAHPRLRLRPSGGFWLFWADDDWMHVSSYREGVWARGDSVQCIPNPGETFRPTFLEAEMDAVEYPAVAWTNSGYGDTWRDVTAIAFGNGHGWDRGEEIADSDQSGWIAPTLTHDLNDDLWLVWRIARTGENRWTHTFCSATCPAPTVTQQGDGARLTWALTSRAPKSRWSVWRAAGDGAPFDSLGVVRAGEDSVLAFDDPAAGPGVPWRYRIRRESVDVRYLWTSEPASYQRADTRVPLGLVLANPTTAATLAFQVTGAVGRVDARIYDLQGRVVLRERLAAGGTGADAFTLELRTSAARRPGIYFLRVGDATGRTTRTARVAVVR